jgi:predicted RNA-binding Zn-ribbon protein involved in translation (DUF1610 family)
MKVCALCGKEVVIDKYFSRTAACPHCGGDLHICLNCRFYSVTSHNKCLEPRAEHQRSREKANFCDYFVLKEVLQKGKGGMDSREEARKRFEDLFKKGA